MTYYEITKKMKDLTMYGNLVNAYQKREAGRLSKCSTVFGLCRYCGFGFKCGYKGFCSHQRKAI